MLAIITLNRSRSDSNRFTKTLNAPIARFTNEYMVSLLDAAAPSGDERGEGGGIEEEKRANVDN